MRIIFTSQEADGSRRFLEAAAEVPEVDDVGSDDVQQLRTPMPRTPRASTTPTRRRTRSAAATSTRSVVDQISQLVSANAGLQRENGELRSEAERLRSELLEIGSALGRLSGGPRGGRGRRGAALSALTVAEAKPKRQRRPITDPEQLERRRAALAKARAARAEKLAAARVGGGGSGGEG